MAAGMGIDRSGNGNHFGENGAQFVSSQWLGRTRSNIDTPTNNFAVWNNIMVGEKDTGDSSNNFTLSHGNRKATLGAESLVGSTMRPTSGKWYCEAYIAQVSGYGPLQGVLNIDFSHTGGSGGHSASWKLYWRGTSSQLYRYAETTADNSAVTASVLAGNILQWAWDCDTGKVWLGNNDSKWRDTSKGTTGDPDAGSNPTFTLSTGQIAKFLSPTLGTAADTEIITVNFGQDASMAGQRNLAGYNAPYTDSEGNGSFFYEPPDGFLAVCTKNLPEPSFKPQEHFEVVKYTGDGNSTQVVTTTFEPDLIWNKITNEDLNHRMYDRVRGFANQINSNQTYEENKYTDYGHPTATSSTSVTIGQGTDSGNLINASSDTGILWNWKAGGSSGSSNTDGSINTTSTSVNTTAGFSISTYTGNATSGATIGHGLGAIPQIIMVKKRNAANGWFVFCAFNTDDPETEELNLEVTEATQDSANIWNDTYPTSSVFSLGNNAAINGNSDTFVAYCWTQIDGFSNFGKYQGNNNANGAYIYTGFRPAFVMTKAMTRTGHWTIKDSKRSTNEDSTYLFANDSPAQGTDAAYKFDLLSNGFKFYNNDDNQNDVSEEYLYMAFAEFPLKYTTAR